MEWIHNPEYWVLLAFLIFLGLCWKAGAHTAIAKALDARADTIRTDVSGLGLALRADLARTDLAAPPARSGLSWGIVLLIGVTFLALGGLAALFLRS